MEEKVQQLLSQLTLEEKAQICCGDDFWHTKGIERLGIPAMMVSDGPHGLRKQEEEGDHLGVNNSIQAVCFPAGCATACSFDENLLKQMGEALGESCRAEGVGVLLGPAINIKRSPLGGRNFEYLSEDPYLAGKLAGAMIQGVQSWQVGTSIKHYAANNQEYRRMCISAQIDERTLREIYLAPFELAIKESKPWTVMCSYNRVNGTHASQNKKLLHDILREEWKFEGFVMSDWFAVSDRVAALEAGLDLEMPGPCPESISQIVQAVEQGTLSESCLDVAVARILRCVLGWKEAKTQKAQFQLEQQHQLAREIEEQCAVLLKNTGVLPLKQEQQIVYIGGYAEKPRYQGGGSSHINACQIDSALQFAPEQVQYVQGFRDDVPVNVEEAVQAAQTAQVAVIFAGLPESYECEGYDRNHMCLPACQNELISRVAAVQPNTVVVLHCGSPVELPWRNQVAGILCMYLGGQGVGAATHRLLYGFANPSGKLAESWPIQLQDNPSYLNFPGNEHEVHYAEGIYVGYRYYDKKNMEVAFPFGYGESYTSFQYDNLTLSTTQMREGESCQVSVDITNTGAVFGQEIVQLYVASNQRNRPMRELKGFAKVALNPGETKQVTLTLDTRSLSYYEPKLADWYAPTGRYEILVGSSSRMIRLSAELDYTAVRHIPMEIHHNTAIGELLSDVRTSAMMNQLIEERSAGTKERTDSEAAKEAITDEMNRQLFVNSPLRGLEGMLQMSREEIEQLIEQLKDKIKP